MKSTTAAPPKSIRDVARALGGRVVNVRRKNESGTGYYWFATIAVRHAFVGYKSDPMAISFFSVGARGETPREARNALAFQLWGHTVYAYRSGLQSLYETTATVHVPVELDDLRL